MIAPEQLAAALERLDPRDWEVLDLSLRRRVPDEALARIFECEPAEVARRRAFAIEHLADDLDVQRGEDLGAVLKALLEPGTWQKAESAKERGERGAWQTFEEDPAEAERAETAGAEPAEAEAAEPEAAKAEQPDPGLAASDAAGARPEEPAEPEKVAPPELQTSETARLFRLTPESEPAHPPEKPIPLEPAARAEPETPAEGASAAPDEQAGRTAQPEEAGGAAPVAEAAPAADDAPADVAARAVDAAPAADPPPAADAAPAKPVPVVAPVNGDLPPGREPVLDMLAERDQERRRERIRTPLLWAVAGGLGAAGLFAAGFVGATVFGNGDTERGSDGGYTGPRRFVPEQRGPLAAPFPSDPRTESCYTTAYVRRVVTIHPSPGSTRTLRLAAHTEWDSPRVFSVVRRRGDWLAVLAPELKNGELGWIRSDSAQLDCVRWSLHVDLSRRRLYVRRDGRTMRRLTIAIGSRRHPTPKGRFAVTDKLKVADAGSPYGCCVLALTGHQTRLPADWPGGDRLAVHATSDLPSIGKPVSLGCMRSQPKQVSWLIRTVPLGTPVFIRA